ncbi:S-adenosyl-L-methionine-dependent methyltransferase [Aspergillus filifer]
MAYGSLAKIPKNTDVLIAGFACVDFSALNNHRKTLDEADDSGGTFWGIVRHAATYHRRLVILEYVKTAPWVKIAKHWEGIDYAAVHADVDTKAYYLPQTRERGIYVLFILEKFRRPASPPAGMFLLDADDRRLEQVEKDMAVRSAIAAVNPRATVNWDRYQVRHQSYRLQQELGVWDTLDANFLRKLVDGYDMDYKERCLELSQGIDREIDSRAFGIVGCITPSGMPYMTTRGGPLFVLRSLALQGLPLNRLLLTQYSQKELQDLAGNAMSSTVVLPTGDSSRTLTPRAPRRKFLLHKARKTWYLAVWILTRLPL